jgi:signal transduction histidine kinase
VRVEIVNETCLELSVQDDGVGGAVATKGGGIAGLADRVHALGGSLTVGPALGGGTLLSASIPLPRTVPAPGPLSDVADR